MAQSVNAQKATTAAIRLKYPPRLPVIANPMRVKNIMYPLAISAGGESRPHSVRLNAIIPVAMRKHAV
jgi:hypothetical protein